MNGGEKMKALSVKVQATDGEWHEMAVCKKQMQAYTLRELFLETGKITKEQIRIEEADD